jgi:cytoskeletal protein CcmA (bactofilin family)
MFKKEERDRLLHSDEIIAFLGKGAEFKGIISYEGTVRIDGRVEGEIITKGTLVVGESAVIQAEITAGTVVSGGRITGNVTASEKVQLLAPTVLTGAVKTPMLIIEEGVRFNGSCVMGEPNLREEPQLAAVTAREPQTKQRAG